MYLLKQNLAYTYIDTSICSDTWKERVEGMWVQSGEVTHNDRTRSLTELSESKPNSGLGFTF